MPPASESWKRSACFARAWRTIASSRRGDGGRRPNTRCSRATIWASSSRLEEIKVFPLLPFGRFVACILDAGLLLPALETTQLVALELEKIIEKDIAELLAKQRLALERVERSRKARRQQRPVAHIGLVALRTRVARMRDAVEACDNLRHDEEIRVRRRLADAVLEPRRRIADAAERADHHAAMVVAPGGTIRRERIGPEAPIAVDGRGGERGARRRVL